MRSSSNSYNISVVANQTARNQLCSAFGLGVHVHEINLQLKDRNIAQADCTVPIKRNDGVLEHHFHLDFYNPKTFGRFFLDGSGRMDVCIFAIGMNETENSGLIETCLEHVMLSEQKIGVQIFGSTSTKSIECFKDFIPDNKFTLQMSQQNDFLEKLINRLDALRKETRQMLASYQEFRSGAPISSTTMEAACRNYSALSLFFAREFSENPASSGNQPLRIEVTPTSPR